MKSLSVNLKSIIAAISGNFVEWYDFALYLFLAPIIAKQFFPESGNLALLGTFTVYAVSFFFRPFGAVLFGHIGDVFGRGLALRISLSCLAGLSIIISLLPSYQSIGPMATVLLCLCRIGQGICLGGEFAGSMIYLGETAAPQKRCLYTCLSNNGSNSGIMAAAGSVTLLSYWLNETEMALYGYRVLFMLGGLIGLIGFAFRSDLKETKVFQTIKQKQKKPMLMAMKQYPSAFMLLMMLLMISSLGSYAFIGYMSTFLQQSLSLTMHSAFRYETLFIGTTLIFVPIMGYISDKISPQRMILTVCTLYIVLSIPCYQLLFHYQHPLFLIPLVILYSMEQSCVPALMLHYFPPEVRYSGVSMTYNICMALVGGLSPLLGQTLTAQLKFQYGIPLLMMIGSVLAIISIKKRFYHNVECPKPIVMRSVQ